MKVKNKAYVYLFIILNSVLLMTMSKRRLLMMFVSCQRVVFPFHKVVCTCI